MANLRMWSCVVADPLALAGMRRTAGFLAVLLCNACGFPTPGDGRTPERLAIASVGIEGTAFRIATNDGRVLRSPDLVGAVLGIRLGGTERRIRIDSVSTDLSDPDVLVHSISVEGSDGRWRPLCDAGPDGRRAGFPVAGRSRADGTLESGTGSEVEIVCTSGAQGKCLRLGYHPWEKLADGAPMLPMFNACVRMMRADYAGDGTSNTRDGTRIEISDTAGINSAPSDPSVTFEAGWDERGAVCVRHARIPALATLQQIEDSSPRLGGRVGSMCTPEKARSLGALIFNSSRTS